MNNSLVQYVDGRPESPEKSDKLFSEFYFILFFYFTTKPRMLSFISTPFSVKHMLHIFSFKTDENNATVEILQSHFLIG